MLKPSLVNKADCRLLQEVDKRLTRKMVALTAVSVVVLQRERGDCLVKVRSPSRKIAAKLLHKKYVALMVPLCVWNNQRVLRVKLLRNLADSCKQGKFYTKYMTFMKPVCSATFRTKFEGFLSYAKRTLTCSTLSMSVQCLLVWLKIQSFV